MVKLFKSLALVLIAGLIITLNTGAYSTAEAGSRLKQKYTLAEIVARMKERGFYNIRVTDDNPPYFDFDACYRGKEFELTIDVKGNIRDKDHEGRCRVKKSAYVK